ncbi:AP-3 complex subunit sigma-1 [Exaiptasia diaphana]|uniref:AP complex mu/sigma subunit domain-containing protein n=1 Tax=Exaiptasia diaphana TaxID=2652724 RepID=A0A913XBQ0_EXADI|nr:AP-3 complex subunit sigma-1 [Exaiptasia diaphana]XP_020901531.1 AP-3 complex subunit sigma-1 [Exaiptasia diaphana]KXJ13609.1 AP-3 complex subunit sigma-1 [Exaiptasia diaphana]KXJ27157.1 AP-3 complex subunit sigma-1 [Exaiptasia diaphana]
MIKAILIFNNHGKPRLSKFYQHYDEDMQQQIIRETFHLVSRRDDNVCNFLEGGSLIGGSDFKLVYRHYATLYFVFCVDSSESELGILDLIQVFVETLDKCFENVCELDLIFHMDKVHNILAEIVMGGMVLETNMSEILTHIDAQSKLEKSEIGISAAPQKAISAVRNISPNLHNLSKPNLTLPSMPSLPKVNLSSLANFKS